LCLMSNNMNGTSLAFLIIVAIIVIFWGDEQR